MTGLPEPLAGQSSLTARPTGGEASGDPAPRWQLSGDELSWRIRDRETEIEVNVIEREDAELLVSQLNSYEDRLREKTQQWQRLAEQVAIGRAIAKEDSN